MKALKYRDVSIIPDVYCSSNCDYSIHVRYNEYSGTDAPVRHMREYYIGTGLFSGYGDSFSWRPPTYLLKEVKAKIIEAHDQGSIRVYENDRDGNKRYENLRYHEPDTWSIMIEAWRNPEPNKYLTSESDEVRLLVMLIRTGEYLLMGKKHNDAKRWGAYLVESKQDERGARTVIMDITHDKFLRAKNFLTLINKGENSHYEIYEQWGWKGN